MTVPAIPLPQLFDRNLASVGRVHPAQLSLNLSLTPLSTACMDLPLGEAAVQVGMFFELFDLTGSVGFFRVCSIETRCGATAVQRIHMEHALCTLGDHILCGYTELGGAEQSTGQVISRLLQGQALWILDQCDADFHFTYSFENENLLTALLSLTAPIQQPMMWSCDFTARPWKVSLVNLHTEASCEARLNRSAKSVNISVDRSSLCTRIYPLGYGEGADQLTIASVNGGVKYLEAAEASTWGVVECTYAETSITDPDTLKSAAQAMLDKLRTPVITIALEAVDLSAMTGETLDRFALGTLCRMPLPEYGLTLTERIIAIRRPDVYGRPENAAFNLANRAASATEDLARLSRKSAVSELYSQGASNQYEVPFADNADPEHPAVMRFYIDEDAIHVNAVKVRWELAPFRGYSKGASSGGAVTGTSEQKIVSSTFTTSGKTEDAYTGYAAAGSDSHRHFDNHVHTINFQITLPQLNISIPNHTHAPLLGIYETAAPAENVAVSVDGHDVPAALLSGGAFDAVSFLSRDSHGRILRGAWHTIIFTPDALTRITAGVHVRTFIRSLTGANL